MRIQSQLRFNANDKSNKDLNNLYQQYLIDPILTEVKQKIRKKENRPNASNSRIIKTDLIVLTQKELIEILKKIEGEKAHEIYQLITAEKCISSVEL